jgi:hypothetical protein
MGTYGLTNGPTDQPTDAVAYRGATLCLKIFHNNPSFAPKINQLKCKLKLIAKMRVEQDEVA